MTRMNNTPSPLTNSQAKQLPTLQLAHVGDAVFELLIRTNIAIKDSEGTKKFHAEAVKYVAAPAQAKFYEAIADKLTDEEMAVFKRGRNVHTKNTPKGASEADYHAATGLEALFGFLYLTGQNERITKLFETGFIHEN